MTEQQNPPQNSEKLGPPPVCGCGFSVGIGYVDLPVEARERFEGDEPRFNCGSCYEAKTGKNASETPPKKKSKR